MAPSRQRSCILRPLELRRWCAASTSIAEEKEREGRKKQGRQWMPCMVVEPSLCSAVPGCDNYLISPSTFIFFFHPMYPRLGVSLGLVFIDMWV